MRRTTEHWVLLGSAPVIAIGFVVAGLWLAPDPRGYGTHERLGMLPCLTMKLWHVPCPGCGVTTSVVLAAHAHLIASAMNQPFGFLVALALAAFVIWAPIAHLRGRDLWVDLTGVRLGCWGPLAGAFLVLSWIYKIWLVRG